MAMTLPRAFIFCSPRKWSKRRLSRPTVLRIPLCRRLSVLLYTKDYYISHIFSNRNWRADSLRQYLKCNCIFGYTSRVLPHILLYCSLANGVLLEFAIYILLVRILQNIILKPWVCALWFMVHKRNISREFWFAIAYARIGCSVTLPHSNIAKH